MKNLTIIFILTGILGFSSCKKEKDFNGSRGDIEKFLGVELVKALDEVGYNMNYGSTPPKVEGKFIVNPAELISSTVESDYTPYTFDDLIIVFKNQNNQALTLDYKGDQIYENSVGKGTFIAGEGNFFYSSYKV